MEKEYNITEDQLIKESPLGNTMIFSNSDAPNGSAWANENTIKVGSDEFIAHGFGSPNIFSKQEILENLAKANKPSLSGDFLKKYVNDFLFLKQSLWVNV